MIEKVSAEPTDEVETHVDSFDTSLVTEGDSLPSMESLGAENDL